MVRKNQGWFFAVVILAAIAGTHLSCEKDTVTPTFIQQAHQPAIPGNLYSLVVSYHCANCHNPSAGALVAGVTMDLRTAQSCYHDWVGVAAGTTDCAAGATIRVAPGDAADSMVWQRLDGTACAYRMPFDGPPYMSQSEVDQFKTWINNGALPQ